MTAPTVLYHCPCSSLHAPPPLLPSSSYQSHPLDTLYFCPECDAIRCPRCVSIEVSTYYCPNCLFEVPSASVRAEKNRCARNCFVCPACENTLQTVVMDPSTSAASSGAGDDGVDSASRERFILYCTYCRWDSSVIGMTFDKHVGLAAQLQRLEDDAPETRELEKLRDHIEPLLRARSALPSYGSGSQSHSHSHHSNALTSAAAALRRDRDAHALRSSRSGTSAAGGRARYTGPAGDAAFGGGRDKELAPYKPVGPEGADELEEIAWMRALTDVEEVASLAQRNAAGSWESSIRAIDQRPLRLPLQSKKSKRCPACRHILIRPEQKATSTKFKVKIVASNYLPALEVSKPEDVVLSVPARRRTGVPGLASTGLTAGTGDLQAGKTYHFQLALTNPLYDPINLRLALQPPLKPGTAPAKRPTFVVALPTNTITVAAFTDAWDYDEDEGAEEELAGARGGMGKDERDGRGKWRLGVVERKANTTKVGGELVVGNQAQGDVKFNLLVTYTYKSEDPQAQPVDSKDTTKSAVGSELKTFAFWTVVHLGTVAPRPQEIESAAAVSS